MKKLLILIVFITFSFCSQKLNIQLNNLDIKEFISITSKITNKNILLPDELSGKINFISNQNIYKKDLIPLLKYVLKSKGYVLNEHENILRIQKDILENNKSLENLVEVIYLYNSDSKDVYEILKNIRKDSKKQNIFISVNNDQNSIILIGEKNEVIEFKSLIKKLDVEKRQVYVQAKIIEISELKTQKIGFEYGLDGFNRYNKGLVSFSSSLNDSGVVSNISPLELSSFGYNISSMKNGISLGVSLNLLSQNGAADIISEPSILCINNKASSIYVGETRSIKTASTITNGGNINETYKREDIGLTLKIKPRVSKKDKVFLEIETKIEDIGQSTTNDQPNTSKKELLTSAIVNNGESVILGGYIKSRIENGEQKVPFFGDIPVLGNLFKSDIELNDKVNLVIIVTPYIVPKSKNLTYIREKLIELKKLEDKYTKITQDGLKKLKEKTKVTSIVNHSYKQMHENRVKELLDK